MYDNKLIKNQMREVWGQAWEQVTTQTKGKVNDWVWKQLWERVDSQVKDQVWDQISNKVNENIT